MAFAAYLLLAGELLGPGEGEVEVWLDAFSATSGRALGLRAYAWTRAEAARFRGDEAAAARWTTRYRDLAKIASRPDDAELAAAVGCNPSRQGKSPSRRSHLAGLRLGPEEEET